MTDVVFCPMNIMYPTPIKPYALTPIQFKELFSPTIEIIQRPTAPLPYAYQSPTTVIHSDPIPIPTLKKVVDPNFESYDEWGLIDRFDIDRVDDILASHIISYYNHQLSLSRSVSPINSFKITWVISKSY